MSSDRTLLVLSHYAGRPLKRLTRLIKTLKRLTTDIVVVVNHDNALTESAERFQSVPLIRRANTGMNIGGWGAAYKFYPNYDFYIFMQDECEVIREDFVNAYQSELSKDNVGMTGEVINPKWNIEWTKLALSPLNYIAGVDALGMPIPRVLICNVFEIGK